MLNILLLSRPLSGAIEPIKHHAFELEFMPRLCNKSQLAYLVDSCLWIRWLSYGCTRYNHVGTCRATLFNSWDAYTSVHRDICDIIEFESALIRDLLMATPRRWKLISEQTLYLHNIQLTRLTHLVVCTFLSESRSWASCPTWTFARQNQAPQS